MDPEIKAMGRIQVQLDNLDEETRARVLAWIGKKYVAPQTPSPAASRSIADVAKDAVDAFPGGAKR